MNDFLKKNIISIVIVIFGAVGSYAWTLIQKGGKQEFKENVEVIFEQKMTDPATLNRILNSPQVTKFSKDAGTKIRNNIIEDVLKKDTNKISMRSFIGMKTGLRDEDVLPELAELLNAWKNGELMTKKEADSYIKKEVRRRTTPSF